MNKLKRVLVVLAVSLGILVIPTAAQAAYGGCDLSADYLPGDVSNGLTFTSAGNWHTNMRRAGDCGRLYTEYTGTYNGPTCAHMKVNTYNEDNSIRVDGPWVSFFTMGEKHRLRYIDDNRKYRAYIRNCNPDYRTYNSNGYFKPGFRIWAN